MIAAVIVLAVAFVASAVVHRLAIRDVARLFDAIEARAHAERHVLAGRIQNPSLFPTAPVAVPKATDGEVLADEPDQVSGFEAAGQDLDHLSGDQLANLFGTEFVNAQ